MPHLVTFLKKISLCAMFGALLGLVSLVVTVYQQTGLTTPFLAAGGSSLVANWLIVALLLRISDGVRSRPRVVIG